MENTRRLENGLRDRVLQRDGYQCRYCGDKRGPFHLDHVYPFVKGGETSFDNLVTACPHCNHVKNDAVGMWPKPIGYFGKKHSPYITLVTFFGVILMMSGVLMARYGYPVGNTIFLPGVAVSVLSIAFNLTRNQE
jgi:hypothetical protein